MAPLQHRPGQQYSAQINPNTFRWPEVKLASPLAVRSRTPDAVIRSAHGRRRERTAWTRRSQQMRSRVAVCSESGAVRTDILVVAALHTLPAVFPHQRHKPLRRDFFCLEFITATGEHIKSLLVTIAEWNQYPSAFCKLLVISRWNFRSAGAHDYSVIRRILSPA